ncbi:MAG: DNA replication/repair protein RecF [Aestuariibacter sp.]
MTISSIALVNFRNIRSAQLHLSPRINIFRGENGAGKTSVLEALYFSLTGKSFRTRSQSDYINRHPKDKFETKVKLSFEHPALIDGVDVSDLTVEVAKSQKSRNNIINNGLNTVSRFSSLTQGFPCFYFSPESLSFLSGDPLSRRSYIDWLLFHVEPSYRDTYLLYKRTHKNRNAILSELKRNKTLSSDSKHDYLKQLDFWTEKFVSLNNTISQLRQDHLQVVFDGVLEITREKFNLCDLELDVSHYKGWSDVDLTSMLKEQADSEMALGYSLSGIHKADILVSGTDGIKGKFVLSRGQTKLVTLAFVIAAVEYIRKSCGKAVVLMLDDVFSELDRLNSEKVSGIIAELQEHQILLTSAEQSLSFTDVHLNSLQHQSKMFHVKHGEFIEEK